MNTVDRDEIGRGAPAGVAVTVVPEVTATVAVVMVVRDEPDERLQRVFGDVARQDHDRPGVLVIAAPPDECEALRELTSRSCTGWLVSTVVVSNPSGRRSEGLNRAVAATDAEFVVRVDARSRPAPDHVRRCCRRLQTDSTIGVVGGVQDPRSLEGASLTSRAVTRALSNPWALGGAAYRRRGALGPVDTVYLGAFRRRELLVIGGYDEGLEANEDFELCQRYLGTGQTVWLEADLVVGYEPRTSLRGIWNQYRAFGASKVMMWQRTGTRPDRRQGAALAVAGTVTLAGVTAALRLIRLACLTGATRPGRGLSKVAALGVGTAAGMIGLATVDTAAGSDDPALRASAVRVSAPFVYPVIWGAWLWGVVSTTLRVR